MQNMAIKYPLVSAVQLLNYLARFDVFVLKEMMFYFREKLRRN